MNTETPRFSPFRNWLSLAGLVVALGSMFAFFLLFALDMMAKEANPYLGILTFVVAPGFFVLGGFLIGVGWLMHRRQAIKHRSGTPFLTIDLARAADRRNLVIFVAGGMLFLLASAIGSYHTYHFAESIQFCGQTCHTPMKPEYTAYLNSPHARVSCTACHVGPGAASFVKAKLNGIHQLTATLGNSYRRPIPTPVKGLLPAQQTCEQCHWPQKFVGNLDRTYAHFLSDEDNTPFTTRLLLKVGGGDPNHGPVDGIHWHMNLANKVEYITTNENRQTIPWVRLTDAKGKQTEYRSPNFKDDPAKYPIRTMDCMDCHNRPAHHFRVPNDAVDLAISTGKIDPALKSIKANVLAALTATNATETAGLELIAKTLKAKYPNEPRVEAVVKEAQRIFSQNFFPEMKADWRAYPDNIGHKYGPGCFRCHDGEHKTADGQKKLQASNCNDCHTILAQGKGAELEKLNPQGHKFAHPDATSDGLSADCSTCHTGGGF